MAILVFSPNGTHVAKPTLEAARTSADCAGKTVVVTSALTQAQSNITGAWPADRGLEIRFSGSLLNSTAFTFTDGRVFSAWQGHVFKGAGAVTGLNKLTPEIFGAKGDGVTDDATAINAASTCLNLSGGGTLLFGAKGYRINSTVYLYSNIRYQGVGAIPYNSSTSGGLKNRGTALLWGGGNTGVMVSLENEKAFTFDGIGLYGNYNYSTLAPSSILPVGASNSSTVIGINFFTTNATADGHPNTAANFSNISVHYCERAIYIGNTTTYLTNNTDFWIIEKFFIGECNRGFVISGFNICCCEIRNGQIYTYGTGIDIIVSGWLKISSVGHGKESPATGIIAYMFVIYDTAGILTIENCQSEGTITEYGFALFTGTGTKLMPTTFIGNAIQRMIHITVPQKALTFIGNEIPSPIYFDSGSQGSNVVSLNDVIAAGNGFTGAQIGAVNLDTNITTWSTDTPIGNGNGTWTPRLFLGATEITAPDTAIGTWVKRGKTVTFKGKFTKAAGAPSLGAQAITMQGLPYKANSDNLLNGIVALDVTINGVLYATATPHYWYIGNDQDMLTLIGAQASTNWTTASIGFGFSGTYQIP